MVVCEDFPSFFASNFPYSVIALAGLSGGCQNSFPAIWSKSKARARVFAKFPSNPRALSSRLYLFVWRVRVENDSAVMHFNRMPCEHTLKY
jgi:hypothetical protein